MRVGFISHKGGVGKSTLCAMSAWRLAGLGKSVLACDFDPQGSLTYLLSGDSVGEEAECLRLFRGLSVEPEAVGSGLGLLGGGLKLGAIESHRSPKVLKVAGEALSQFPADVILIDGPTGVNRALSEATLLASDGFIVPVDPSPLSVAGLVDFLRALERIRERYGREPRFLGVVLNMAERHTVVTQKVCRLLERLLGEDRLIASIPKRTRLRELAMTRAIPADPVVMAGLDAICTRILHRGRQEVPTAGATRRGGQRE